MKQIILGLALITGINGILFSQEETWLSAGTSFDIYSESGIKTGDIYMESLGFNFSGYGFWNEKNIGMFFNYALLLSLTKNMSNDYTPVIQADFILGPAFRYAIKEKIKLYFGIGLDINLSALDGLGLGMGGDAGLKFDITNVLYISAGTLLTYTFAGYRLDGLEPWVNKYSAFSLRPYIAIGLNHYKPTTKGNGLNNGP